MNWRLAGALAAYALLTALSFWMLSGIALKAVLFLFAALLMKTLVAWRAGW